MKELTGAFLEGFREAWLDYWKPMQWLISKLTTNRQNEKVATASEKIDWTIPKKLALIYVVIVLGSLTLSLCFLIIVWIAQISI